MNISNRIKRSLAGLLLVSAVAVPAAYAGAAPGALNGSSPASAVPASPSTSSVIAAWTPEQVDAYAEAAMKRLHVPGLAVGIVHEGEIAYMQGYGTAGPGAGPMTPQTPLAIGSTTKSFTALAVMQLVEAGKIDPDAPVTDYLPDFRLADADASARITAADLLHQTSGLSTYDGIAFLAKGDGTLSGHIRSLQSVSQKHAAGAVYEYSNLNYNILGAIVERVSGESYGDYVEEKILRPLGMNESFASPERAAAALAERSDRRPPSGHQLLFGLTVPTRLMEHSGTVPSGYLVSTAEDMSKYLIMQMEGDSPASSSGGGRLLSPEGFKRMHEPAADMRDGSFYGMGWVNSGSYIWHNGTTENTYSEMRIHDGYGLFILANSSDPLIVSYAGILPGLDDIVNGRTPSLNSLPDFAKLYMIADGIVLAIVLLFLWSVRSLFRWKKAFRPAAWKFVLNLVLLLACNVAFPLLILHFVSGLAPWEVVVTWAPGIGWGLIALPWLLLATGGLKLLLMLLALAGKNRTPKPSLPANPPLEKAEIGA
ncbi:serine hydrolase domain-containing protein [Saccharibacillus alkalitolerans]|uniref:Beta-lactamase family protein n=1 Tax=Saccharibacillus alkalitolerans TaxID=2705290 RepID=A0ABX0F8K4_9BACL|nr:serine hydrolase domain-containing protein [Saccharibacillus alkalitolerans]NGZ76720.1 beta-lactamase family protein [Saccharibacillus alkalitolerans]